jgi:hypothetical protein
MKLSDAIARLERAGSEHSRMTEKLRQAAIDTAEFIVKAVGREADDLPRSYTIQRNGSGGRYLFLHKDGHMNAISAPFAYVNDYGQITNDRNDGVDRNLAMIFAQDVATGLLDEVAIYLEKQAERMGKAAMALDKESLKFKPAMSHSEGIPR